MDHRPKRPANILIRTTEGVRAWRQAHGHSPGVVPALRYHHLVVNRGPALTLDLDCDDRRLSTEWPGGHWALVPAGLPSAWAWYGSPEAQLTHVELSAQMLKAQVKHVRSAYGRRELAVVAPVHDPAVLALVDALEAALKRADAMSLALARSIGRTLGLYLLLHHGVDRRSEARLKPLVRAKVKRAIEASLGEPLSIRDLAAVAGMSRESFSRAFSGSFGCAPSAYLVRRRLAKSRQLLRTTSDSIADIALACGFGSQSGFGKRFLAAFGQTPSHYRHGGVGKEG
ncbi:MAG: helix-turn-helix domain-containing protein [Lysobacteraceae bacterium]